VRASPARKEKHSYVTSLQKNKRKEKNYEGSPQYFAEKRGCDELMNRAEYALRDSPQALRHALNVYRTACLELYKCIERHYRRIAK
jgi:hypothetical protein